MENIISWKKDINKIFTKNRVIIIPIELPHHSNPKSNNIHDTREKKKGAENKVSLV